MGPTRSVRHTMITLLLATKPYGEFVCGCVKDSGSTENTRRSDHTEPGKVLHGQSSRRPSAYGGWHLPTRDYGRPSIAPPFKKRRPWLRIALQPSLSTNPTFFTPAFHEQPPPSSSANHHATMSFFHTVDSTFCGEDQTSAWSETAGIEYAAPAFDLTTVDPILVSADLFRDMRSYSPFGSCNTLIGCLLGHLTSCPTSMSGLGRSTISRQSINLPNHPTCRMTAIIQTP
jgi:hypothetical protein